MNMYYGPWKIPPVEKPPTAVKVVCAGENEKVTVAIAIRIGIALLYAGLAILLCLADASCTAILMLWKIRLLISELKHVTSIILMLVLPCCHHHHLRL